MNERDDEVLDAVEYDPKNGTYHTSYDLDGRYSLFYTIIELVEEATGEAQFTMDPLFTIVDPEALESLFQSQDERTARVEFEYCNCKVTTRSDGTVSVRILEDS